MGQELNSRLLSRFLRSRRGALSPCDVGLAESGRRRTPGLRREEVAMLAGVSVSWYTWLEQGRSISVSASVLERLCDVLQLDSDQREYLFALVHNRPAPLRPLTSELRREASPATWRTLEALTVPAFALTHRWDVIAWNDIVLHFRDYSRLPSDDRNLLKMLVTDPMHKENRDEYERKVARATSILRLECSHAGEDPALEDLIEELSSLCPVFRRHWQESNSLAQPEGENILYHPELGGLRFENVAYVPKGEPHVRIVIFFPRDEKSAQETARLAQQPDCRGDVERVV